jgi:hypothetical protein
VSAGLESLLARLIEQQTAQLAAYTEGLRLQRVLVEHLLGAGVPAAPHSAMADPVAPMGAVPPAPTPTPPPPAAAAPARLVDAPLPPAPVSEPVPAPAGAADWTDGDRHPDEPPLPEAPPPEEPDYSALDRDVRRPGAAGPTVGGDGTAPPGKPGWRVLRGGAGAPLPAPPRSAPPSKPEPAAGGLVDAPELARLKRLQAAQASGAPNLVLNYGPHQGKTLHQLALEEPEALKALAVDAHTPEVRLAARQVVQHLGLHRLRPPGRTRRPSTRRS